MTDWLATRAVAPLATAVFTGTIPQFAAGGEVPTVADSNPATSVLSVANGVAELIPKLVAAKLIYWAGEPLIDQWLQQVLGRPAFNNKRVLSILNTENSFTRLGFMCLIEHLREYGQTEVLDVFQHSVLDARFYRDLPGNVYGLAKTVASRLFGTVRTPAGEVIRRSLDAPTEMVNAHVAYDTQLRLINKLTPFPDVTLGDFRPTIFSADNMPEYTLRTWVEDAKNLVLTPLQEQIHKRVLKGDLLDSVNGAITAAGKALDDLLVLASDLQRRGEIVRELPQSATHGVAFAQHANVTMSRANLRYTIHEVYEAFELISERIVGQLEKSRAVVPWKWSAQEEGEGQLSLRLDVDTLDFDATNSAIDASLQRFMQELIHRETNSLPINSDDRSRIQVIVETWAICQAWGRELNRPDSPLAQGLMAIPAVSLRFIPDDPLAGDAAFVTQQLQIEEQADEEGLTSELWARFLGPLLRDDYQVDVLGEAIETMYAILRKGWPEGGIPPEVATLPVGKGNVSPEAITQLAEQAAKKRYKELVNDSTTTARSLMRHDPAEEIRQIVDSSERLWLSEWQQRQTVLDQTLQRIIAQETDTSAQQRLVSYHKTVMASVTSSSPIREWWPVVRRLYNDAEQQSQWQFVEHKVVKLWGGARAFFQATQEWLNEQLRFWQAIMATLGVLSALSALSGLGVKWIFLGLRQGVKFLGAWLAAGVYALPAGVARAAMRGLARVWTTPQSSRWREISLNKWLFRQNSSTTQTPPPPPTLDSLLHSDSDSGPDSSVHTPALLLLLLCGALS